MKLLLLQNRRSYFELCNDGLVDSDGAIEAGPLMSLHPGGSLQVTQIDRGLEPLPRAMEQP